MIKVENLTKIYKSKKKEKCVALNNVSFSLADSGFVFIIGKSGSGKTTLLSILGGLDNITSGNIVVNGNSFADFKNKDYVNYRNSMIGYIFQDFHLIDDLTILENIKISLDLQNINNDSLIIEALKNVDLVGYENRFPKELSGGEKQRIAIARALVKNPRIILADEPTGNLDTKTTAQILSLLKELSKDRLVLIVSHNLSDARTYADRIIELSSGKIINDYIRNKDFSEEVVLNESELIIPLYKKISFEESKMINDELIKGKIKKFTQSDEAFIKNNVVEYESNYNKKIENKHFSFKNILSLAIRFLKKDLIRLILYSFVVACLVVILGLSQLIVNFDSSKLLEEELNSINQNSVSLNKSNLVDGITDVNKNCIINVEKDDIANFYDAGYEGNIYELVNVTLDYGNVYSLSHNHTINQFTISDLFYNGTRGTLITTENYVINTFGELHYLCLADKIEAGGIYITDYSADAMIYYLPNYFKSYEDLMGDIKCQQRNIYGYINGVIYIGYKEKYSDIREKLTDINLTKDDILELTSTEEYRTYYDDIMQNLSISYTFNNNFKSDFIELNSKTWCPLGNSFFQYDGKRYNISGYAENALTRSNHGLNDNEIVMNYKDYNKVFDTNYSSETISSFIPHEVVFNYCYYYDMNQSEIVKSFKVKIVAIDSGASCYMADNIFKEVMACNNFTSALFFDDISNVSLIFDVGDELGYTPNSIVALSLATMTKAVNVFSDFFNIIFIGLCICSLIILVNYGVKLIKERTYEIGIIKALGARNIDLTFIFGFQIVLAAILIIVMYILGSILFIDFSNEVLIRSLLELAPNNFIMDIDVLFINWDYLFQNSILVIFIVFISFIIPNIRLRNLKPTNIIKAKE